MEAKLLVKNALELGSVLDKLVVSILPVMPCDTGNVLVSVGWILTENY